MKCWGIWQGGHVETEAITQDLKKLIFHLTSFYCFIMMHHKSTFFKFNKKQLTHSWSWHPVWSLQTHLDSRHSQRCHHTAPFHSGHSPSQLHPAPSHRTAGHATLQDKTHTTVTHSVYNTRRNRCCTHDGNYNLTAAYRGFGACWQGHLTFSQFNLICWSGGEGSTSL